MAQKGLSISEVKKRIERIHGDVVVLDESTYKNVCTKALFIDKDFGNFWLQPRAVYVGYRHPGSKFDIVGQRFGKLTAIEYVSKDNRKDQKPKWKCKCDCGNEVNVSCADLKRGHSKSCGCLRKRPNRKQLMGKKFGKLTVVGFSHIDCRKNAFWVCKCECGMRKIIRIGDLSNGHTRSCGCATLELAKQTWMKKYGVENPSHDPDIALKIARSQKNVYILKHWKTGKEIVCQASYEKKTVEYFNKNNIDFRWQCKIFDVVVDGKNRTYRPDFYLFSLKKWIEIKGYKYEMSMKKYNYFHKYIKPNSELWDEKKLKKMDIL